LQGGESSELWVEKYKPTSTKTIIGQQGDSSNMRKLTNWLRLWDQGPML
jgi:replication factor C subunit 1